MKQLLLIFLLVHVRAQLEVVIEFSPPDLILTLPVTNATTIGHVTFHLNVKHRTFQVPGVKTDKGWQYRTSNIDLEGAVAVYAYAEVYHMNGSTTLVTKHKFFSIEKAETVKPPSRSVRGATYFRDDFNNFNGGNWKYEVSMYGGYNGEFQVYTNDPKNVYTRGGSLYIHPIPTVNDNRFNENFLHTGVMDMNALFGLCTEPNLNGCRRDGHNGILPPVMSGKLKSVPSMKYGILEVRARIPKGDWLWPAIWMLPTKDTYGTWPRSGEIDIMESRGNNGDVGVGTVTSTLHWGPSENQNRFMKTHGEKRAASWHDAFHTWKLEWTPDHIITSVDNQQIMNVNPGSSFWNYGGFSGGNVWASGSKMAPFDKDFYLILNVAVGGTSGFFADDINFGVRKPWSDNSPKAAEDFWNAHNQWLPTWQGDNVALLVDYVQFQYL